MITVSDRFAQIVRAVIDIRGMSMREFCSETGIDRRNLSRMLGDPAHNQPQFSWITAVCTKYGASAEYIVNGIGEAFK